MFEPLLCPLLGLLCIMVPVGHGIWLLLAAIFRTTPRSADPRRRWRRCVRCGTEFVAAEERCPQCDLDPRGAAAAELRDLEAATRAVQALHREGGLDAALCDEVFRCIEARHRLLINVDRPERRPTPEAAQALLQMEQWLGNRDPDAVARRQQLRLPAATTPHAGAAIPVVVRPAEPAQVEALVRTVPGEQAAAKQPLAAEPAGTPPVVETPAAPRRSLGEWLAVFMEERNVLWGEVIGGMLIVGCSIALVISLWQTLERIPYSPFLILATLTSGLIGAGFYTLHHWKLQSTSRGLLLIGMLLMPLNFLVLAGLSRDLDAGLLEVVTATAGLGFFGWLALLCGRVLVRDPLETAGRHADGLFVLAMTASALALLLIPHLLTENTGSPVRMLLGLLPAAVQAAAVGMVLWRTEGERNWTVHGLRGLFALFGVTGFACVTALGFLIYSAYDAAGILTDLALPTAIFGLPLLVGGALIHCRMASDAEGSTHESLGRTAGTGTALFGIAVLFAAFAMALPDAPQRWIVGVVNVVALAATAWGLRLRLLHVPAQVYLILLCHAGWHGAVDGSGARPELSVQLAVLMLLQIAIAEACAIWNRRSDGLYYAAGGGVATVLAAGWAISFSSEHPRVAAGVLGLAGVVWLIANRRWRVPLVNYVALLLLFGGVHFTTGELLPNLPVTSVWLWSLLVHATLGVALAAVLDSSAAPPREWLLRVYVIPLRATAIAGSVVAAGLLLPSVGLAGCALASAWLAAIWLAIACAETSAVLFGGFQLALAAAVATGALAWAESRGWNVWEPRSLHLAAVGVAGLSLLWEALRRGASSRLIGLLPERGAVDRVLLGGLLAGQALLAIAGAAPAVADELLLRMPAELLLRHEWHAQVAGAGAWLLLALGTAALLVAARPENLAWPAHGLVVALLTVPVLLAADGPVEQHTAAATLRWGLALAFLLGSALLWLRGYLDRRWTDTLPMVSLRGALIAGAVVPVLYLTAVVAWHRLQGNPLPAPQEGSLFARLGASVSLLVPLGLISLTAAGHGFRDRLPHHLLAGGLLGTVSLMAGRVLQAHRLGGGIGAETWVQTLQLGAAFAWLWTMGWLLIARRLAGTLVASLIDSSLLSAQGFVGAALFAVVVLPAGLIIAAAPTAGESRWVIEAGSPLSGFVLALTTAGFWLRGWSRGERLALPIVGMLSLAGPVWLACLAVRYGLLGAPVLMLALAGLALCWSWGDAALTRLDLRRWVASTAERYEEMPATWAVVAGSGAVAVALVWTIRGEWLLWSATALSLVAVAAASLAWQRRRETWALISGPLLVFATSLLVWQWHFDEPLSSWAHLLWQIDVAVLGAASVFWLLARNRLYGEVPMLSGSPCLACQVILGLVANTPLLFAGLLSLIDSPRRPGGWLPDLATPPATLALGLNLVAACWYVGLVAPARVIHVIGAGGILAGILVAGAASTLGPVDWLAHHALTGSWTLFGLLVLTLAWASHRHAALGPYLWRPETRAAAARLLRTWLPESTARAWVAGCGIAVVVLTLLAFWPEPNLPAWSSGNVLALSLLLGALAVWSRGALYAYGSALMFNVVGFLLHGAWARAQLHGAGPLLTNGVLVGTFIATQVVCFSVASAAWAMLERYLARRDPPVLLHGLPSCALAALVAGIHLLTLLVGVAMALQVVGLPSSIGEPFAWVSLLMLVAAALTCLVARPESMAIRYAFYPCGLFAIGLVVQAFPIAEHGWSYVVLLVSGYALAATALVRCANRVPVVARLARHQDATTDYAAPFLGSQAILACALGLSSLVMSLNLETVAGRLSGAATCLLAMAIWPLAAMDWPRIVAADLWVYSPLNFVRNRHFPRYMALLLGVLAAIEAAWAPGDPTLDSRWLQRAGAAFAAVTVMALAYRVAARRLGVDHPWREPCRNIGADLVVLAHAGALLLFALELGWYMPDTRTTPLAGVLVGVDGLALLLLVGLNLHYALNGDDDPFGIPATLRGLYVYAAEAVLVGVWLHVRLNVPDWIPPVFGRYWTLTLMVIAFAGVGSGEYCRRRAWTVLAAPLRRTAIALAFVPVLAYLVQPLAGLQAALGDRLTGLQPILRYLDPDRFPSGAGMHALCWLLLGLLHGWLAGLRKSANQLLLACLFINFGFWALLGARDDLAFLTHPQLWLIPIGLILLAAEFINRPQLPAAAGSGLLTLGLTCIYLSSTLDMFITGLGNSIVLPLVLAVLCVLGVLGGILLRMRAPLLFGSAFLGVVIFAQIWHAAVDREQAWVWWASGLALGLAIIGFFAYFEKHRPEVLKMFEEMRRWR